MMTSTSGPAVLHRVQELEPRQVGHLDVEAARRRSRLLRGGQRLDGVVERHHVVALRAEDLRGRAQHERRHRRRGPWPCACVAWTRYFMRCLHPGEREGSTSEDAALADGRVDGMVRRAPRRSDSRWTSPRPVPCPSGLVVKNGSKIRFGCSGRFRRPGVADPSHTPRSDAAPHPTVICPARRQRLDRVHEEVEHDLLELGRVPVALGGRAQLELQLRARAVLELREEQRRVVDAPARGRTGRALRRARRRENRSRLSTIRLRASRVLDEPSFSRSSAERSFALMSCAKARIPPSGLLISWATPPASCPPRTSSRRRTAAA